MSTTPHAHALLAPSAADRWMTCPGSVALSKNLPDIESEYSVEGTDHHEVAAYCLEEQKDAKPLIGMAMPSGAILTEENALYVQQYVDLVRAYAETVKGNIKVEERVPLHWLTNEADAYGTSDAVIVSEDTELIVMDLKFGMGVKVDADHNAQLQIYALGVIQKNDLWEFVKTVRLVICQPRLGHVSEWVVTVDALRAFAAEVRRQAHVIWATSEHDEPVYRPSEKACRFCRAKAICPALRATVEHSMTDGFEMIDNGGILLPHPPPTGELLALAMNKVELVEEWCRAVRAEVERRLLRAEPVPGYKLVQGKKGTRKWNDEKALVEFFKRWRMKKDQMYTFSLLSPAQYEKKYAKSYPERWVRLQPVISQSPGGPSVAPESDPRPVYEVAAPLDGFERVTNSAEDLI